MDFLLTKSTPNAVKITQKIVNRQKIWPEFYPLFSPHWGQKLNRKSLLGHRLKSSIINKTWD